MSLYVASCSNINQRESNAIFFAKDKRWFCLSNKEETPCFDVGKGSKDYLEICKIAAERRYSEFEILVDDPSEFVSFVSFFSSYLLDKDLSIGLLVKGEKAIRENRSLLSKLGIPFSPIKPEPQFHTLYSMAKLNISSFLSVGDVKRTFDVIKDEPRLGSIVLEESFHDKLMKHLVESNRSNADVYHEAGISKQVFSKIISTPEMIPSKGTVICLCIGLHLRYFEAVDLLESCGYAFSKSLMFDRIIATYLKDEIYDLDQINMDLNEFNCPLLGWKPRED